jgi:hypothetical protein
MSTTDFSREDTRDPEAPLYCANHPNEETYVRCSRCEKPICARCRVRTPVGFRCFDCANLQVLPTYAIGAEYYIKAAIFGFAAAGAAGVLMGLFPAFEFWAALIMGIAVPEAVAIASNQKRGPGLQMVAVAAVVFGFALSRVVLTAFPGLIPLGFINQPYESDIEFLANLPVYVTQYTILWLALAIFLSYRRLQ